MVGAPVHTFTSHGLLKGFLFDIADLPARPPYLQSYLSLLVYRGKISIYSLIYVYYVSQVSSCSPICVRTYVYLDRGNERENTSATL